MVPKIVRIAGAALVEILALIAEKYEKDEEDCIMEKRKEEEDEGMEE